MDQGPAIAIEGLTKRFGDLAAVDDLTLDVQQGEVFGFLGPNGAGKTTTIRMLLALARSTEGHATIFGLDVWRDSVEVHSRLAYVPGELNVWPSLRGREILDLFGAIHGRVDPVLRDRLSERFDFDPSKKGRTYSRGNRQKIGLIAAFSTQADLLLLDEPTTGLDPLMEATFRECVEEVRGEGRTVFLSSHMLSEVEAVCDRVGILRQGKLVEVGTLDDLRGLAVHSVVVRFAGPVPDLSHVVGVEKLEVSGDTARFHQTGRPNDLLAVLAQHGVIEIESREPSLEEVFMAHYGDGGGPRPEPGDARG